MYNQNIDDDDSDSDSGSSVSADSGAMRTIYNPRVDVIDHADALQHWAKFMHGASTVKEPFIDAIDTSAESPPPNEAGVGLFNTQLHFVETRRTYVIMVDSLDRDQHVYPLPTQVRLKLPRIYKNVERIDIVQIKFFCGLYAISKSRNNNTLWISDVSGIHAIVVPDGTYQLYPLMNAVAAAATASSSLTYTVSFSPTTGRIQISATGQFNLLFYSKAYPLYNQTAYSEWGLGWVLGWGGQPVDLSGATSYTADHFPRIVDDYIYLQLNDTERMNDIDHTDIEDAAMAQDSTGQVSHYFGKLLLNTFGNYAQTFVESPKLFTPVLGRLDRLNFTWTDRHGNPLTGPDAASCDWHMALRITEIVEVPTVNSTLTQSVNRGSSETFPTNR
jgi:hypothetical protein